MLQVGDPIPDFVLESDSASEVKAADLRGKRFVLYFYPRDDTPGCTIEACSFRDNLPNFSSLDVPVYGISADDVDAHTRFRNKVGLTFPLIADPDHQVAEAFGTWVEKNNYGKTYMGIQRSTFIIDPNGRIEHVWEKVTPAEHVKQVLDYLHSPAPSTAPLPASASSPSSSTTTQDARASNDITVAAPAPETTVKAKATRKTTAKKASARKTGAKKATKKAASKKSSAKKAVKKTAAKKSSAKKGTRR